MKHYTTFLFRLIIAALSTLLLTQCGSSGSASGKPIVFVAILPQAEFVERISGKVVDVKVLVSAGQSEETYQPTPRQMTDLGRASLYFKLGLPFENRLVEKIAKTLPELKIVDTRTGLNLRKFSADEAHEHELDATAHGHAHDHDGACRHGVNDIDPHIWMAPTLVKQQVRTICDALCTQMPEKSDFFRQNLETYLKELDELDRYCRMLLEPFTGRAFYCYHPSYGYFADAYGLKQIAIQRPDKSPSPKELSNWIERARQDKVQVIFVQKQFTSKPAEAIAQSIGGRIVLLDPLHREFSTNFREMAQAIAAGLAGEQTTATVNERTLP